MVVASIAWTVTQEEIFREWREVCEDKSQKCKALFQRKFFYVFTCEYCFSHYVTIFFLILTGYKLLLDDWRGFIISGFALVWVANVYMSLIARVKQEIKKDKVEITAIENEIGS